MKIISYDMSVHASRSPQDHQSVHVGKQNTGHQTRNMVI